MTTAHCLDDKGPDNIIVTVGPNQQSSGLNRNPIPVVAINTHPNYNLDKIGDFDISIVELATYLTFDDVLTP